MSARRCSQCRAPMVGGQGQRLCRACLLSMGLAPEGDGLSDWGWAKVAVEELLFGDYEVLEEVARGGMGVVFRARQIHLDRVVALKMLLAGPLAVSEHVERFRVEAESAARLRHPNIVAIHEFGQHEGRWYLAMEFVEGQNLSELAREGPLLAKRAAAYLKKAAEAVHYAHEQGVLHRDIKPSNILVDIQDQIRITDFGLAKQLKEESELTVTGQVIGSPSYVSPEQALGQADRVGLGSDVYSLGAVLYEMLTGRAPFVGPTVAAVLKQVHEEPVLSPRLLNPAVPRDLETICLKCLEKEPSRRYASAQALAEDLGRFLEGIPVSARPLRWPGKMMRWSYRNPKVSLLAGTAILLLMTILIGLPYALVRINRERLRAVRHAADADAERRRTEAAFHRLEIRTARESFQEGRSAEGLARLAWLVRRNPADQAAAAWLLHELTYRSFPLPVLPPLRHPDWVNQAFFSPEGSRILTVAHDGKARLWNARSGQPVGPPMAHEFLPGQPVKIPGILHPMQGLFSPDGIFVATCSIDGLVRLWNAQTGAALGSPLVHDSPVTWIEFLPGSDLLISATGTGRVHFWKVPSGLAARSPMQVTRPFNSAAFDPSGTRLMTSQRNSAFIWEINRAGVLDAGKPGNEAGPTGQPQTGSTAETLEAYLKGPLGPPLTHADQIISATFTPDGAGLATFSFDMTVQVWDWRTGELLGPPLRHESRVRSAQFSLDGSRLLTASEDGTARLWDIPTGTQLQEPMRHAHKVWSAHFSPTEEQVVTASSDKTVQVWDVRPGQGMWANLKHQTRTTTSFWMPSGRRLLAVGNMLTVWELGRPDPVSVLPLNLEHRIVWAEADAPRQQLALATSERIVQLFHLEVEEVSAGPELPHQAKINHVEFSANGRWLLTASEDGLVRLWDAQTGREARPPLSHGQSVLWAGFSPDDQWIATGCEDGLGRLWEVRRNTPPTELVGHAGPVLRTVFSPDGQWLVTASEDATARLWRLPQGMPFGQPMRHRGAVSIVAFSPDSRRLATGSQDHSGRLWSVPETHPLSPYWPHEDLVHAVAFHPAGTHLVTASSDGAARLWDGFTGQPLSSPLPQSSSVKQVDFSPDGRWLAVVTTDWRAHLWPVFQVNGLAPAWLPELAEAVAGQCLDADGNGQAVGRETFLEVQRSILNRPPSSEGPLLAWAHWFLADRSRRPLLPPR